MRNLSNENILNAWLEGYRYTLNGRWSHLWGPLRTTPVYNKSHITIIVAVAVAAVIPLALSLFIRFDDLISLSFSACQSSLTVPRPNPLPQINKSHC